MQSPSQKKYTAALKRLDSQSLRTGPSSRDAVGCIDREAFQLTEKDLQDITTKLTRGQAAHAEDSQEWLELDPTEPLNFND